MADLSARLNQFRIGELRPAARMWEFMVERDGILTAAFSKRRELVGSLEWEIIPADDSPEAEEHAAALKYFYNHIQTTSVLDGDEIGDVSMLIEQMATAIGYRYSVHEMLLRVNDASRREVTATFRHCPVWFFERRRGFLGFMREDFETVGQPLEAGKWLTAVGQGHMMPASVFYAIKHFPMRDWMLYCARFGIPGIHGETTATYGSAEWTAFEESLKNFANDWITATSPGTKINLIESGRAGVLPMAPLVQKAEDGYSILFRGSNLASSTSGPQAVGANIAQGEVNIFEQRDARWITATCNNGVDRPVLRYLFNEEPKAWFKLLPRKGDNTERDLKTAEFMLTHRVELGEQDLRERLGWAKPEDEEDTVGGDELPDDPMKAAQPGKDAPKDAGDEEDDAEDAKLARTPALQNEMVTADLLRQQALQARLSKALAADLQPLRSRLAAVLQIQDPETKQAKLRSLLTEFDQLRGDILLAPDSAAVIEDVIGEGFKNGVLTQRRKPSSQFQVSSVQQNARPLKTEH